MTSATSAGRIAGFDSDDIGAIVYDLDGTLVRLAVDWDAAAAAVESVLRERGCDPPASLWAMLEFADERGHRAVVEETIGGHECKGARESERLALADRVGNDPDSEGTGTRPKPTGVCSLNCERACRIALDAHDLTAQVDAVIGRDSVSTYKPDPEPLLAVLKALDATPARALFIGDSERDERTAERAGTRFVYVSELLSGDAD